MQSLLMSILAAFLLIFRHDSVSTFELGSKRLGAAFSAYRRASSPPLLRLRQPSSTLDDSNNSHNRNIHTAYAPCLLTVSGISLRYNTTLFRRLTSSVPYREYALRNLSFQAQSSDWILITGASSSGKSTLLHVILSAATSDSSPMLQKQHQQQRVHTVFPSSGSISLKVQVDERWCSDAKPVQSSNLVATPIYLTQKPLYDNSRSVETILNDVFRQTHRTTRTTKVPTAEMNALFQAVTLDLMESVGLATSSTSSTRLRDDDVWKKTPSQLSLSAVYRLELVKACLQSIFQSSALSEDVMTTLSRNDPDDMPSVLLPAPILLLDEWLDTETTTVIQAVRGAIRSLCRPCLRVRQRTLLHSSSSHSNKESNKDKGGLGVLALCVTHYPERWNTPTTTASATMEPSRDENSANSYHLTLSRGEILSAGTTLPLLPSGAS